MKPYSVELYFNNNIIKIFDKCVPQHTLTNTAVIRVPVSLGTLEIHALERAAHLAGIETVSELTYINIIISVVY